MESSKNIKIVDGKTQRNKNFGIKLVTSTIDN